MPSPGSTLPQGQAQGQPQGLPLTAILAALTVAVTWGFNFIVMKHAVSEFPPLLLTALRFGLAAVPMVFFVKRPACGWWPLLAFGFLFGIVKFGVLFTAFAFGLPSGLGAVMLQAQAFFTILLGVLLLGERPSRTQRFSLAVAALGVVIIAQAVSGTATFLPVALTVAAAAAWGVANIVVKRLPGVDMLSFMVWASVVPPLPMLALSLLSDGPAVVWHALTSATWLGWGAVLYLAYPVSVVTLAMWGSLLTRYSTASVAPFALLVPVVGYVCSALIYGERLTPATFVGAALLLASLAINAFAPSRAARPA